MKHVIGILLAAWWLTACSSEQKPQAAYDLETDETSSQEKVAYEGCDALVRFSMGFSRLDELTERSLDQYEFLDSIHFDEGCVTLVLSEEKGEGFFEFADSYPGSWNYCCYHDVYTAFFAFKEVKEVRLRYAGDNITYLPCLGDYDPLRVPATAMKREWYGSSLDYGEYIIMDDSSFYEDSTNRVVKASILDMVALVLKAKNL